MTRRMSRQERRKAFLREAEVMYGQLEAWYDKHPEASFGEIEAEARRQRREMMGKAMSILVNGRDVGKKAKAPKCGRCGEAMRFKGYRRKTVIGLEGDTELERAYYVCQKCQGATLFPPG